MTARKSPWWIHVSSWLIMALLFLPLAFVAAESFNANRLGQSWGGFSLQWYGKLMHNSTVLLGTWNTLVVALASTALSTVIGTLLAIGLHRTPWPRKLRGLIHSVVELPVVTPDILMAVALV
ncbi:MAG TPA: hypothetical protein VLM37_06440, partial [Fibrobacteraceae bacterium]|nr:hypothetical protein [Fibrobacteraceae bacterium]